MNEYSIELTVDRWQALRNYLIEHNISFEPCECFNLIHVTIWCNENQAAGINRFLEVIAA